jgi:hypothetical protein
MGMFKREDIECVIDDLLSAAVTTKQGPYRLGKLLFSQQAVEGAWLNITLQESELFIQDRLQKYSDSKRQARMFFPDELMQYLAWKSGVMPSP